MKELDRFQIDALYRIHRLLECLSSDLIGQHLTIGNVRLGRYLADIADAMLLILEKPEREVKI